MNDLSPNPGYLPLERTFWKYGGFFEQVEREGWKAIYQVSQKPGGVVVYYEVIYVELKEEARLPGGNKSTPRMEAFPSSSQWGQRGWTFTSKQRKEAMDFYENMKPIKKRESR